MWERRKKLSKQLRELYVHNALLAIDEAKEEDKLRTADKEAAASEAYMLWLENKKKADFESKMKRRQTAEEEARSKRVKAIESEVNFGNWIRRVTDEQ